MNYDWTVKDEWNVYLHDTTPKRILLDVSVLPKKKNIYIYKNVQF